ncbi:MAG TPA: hypothetical protein VNX68_13855 [Nitrosopumilaceae archaeon]|jgi:hypothetical protein|nr:hypothetical protein [Nitrosopumilaceae archaeon]
MKIKLTLIVLLSLFQLSIFGQCPVKGDNKNAKFETLDSLKNRTKASTKIVSISLDDIMKPGDDTKRFSEDEYVSIIAYVYDVKYGGAETCNCHSKDKDQLDIHIEIVANLSDASGNKRMIVEINRFTRVNDKTLTYEYVHSLKGKKVEIQGLFFFDEEHKQNAINTSPNGTNVWRATCWEVHPCLVIKEVNK